MPISLCVKAARPPIQLFGKVDPTLTEGLTSAVPSSTLPWEYWLCTCTCLSVPMSQTGNFSAAHCREE